MLTWVCLARWRRMFRRLVELGATVFPLIAFLSLGARMQPCTRIGCEHLGGVRVPGLVHACEP